MKYIFFFCILINSFYLNATVLTHYLYADMLEEVLIQLSDQRFCNAKWKNLKELRKSRLICTAFKKAADSVYNRLVKIKERYLKRSITIPEAQFPYNVKWNDQNIFLFEQAIKKKCFVWVFNFIKIDRSHVHKTIGDSYCASGKYLPLHLAVEEQWPEMVAFFLQNGAKTNFRDGNNKTPLSIAQEKKHAEIINLLEVAGRKQNFLGSIKYTLH